MLTRTFTLLTLMSSIAVSLFSFTEVNASGKPANVSKHKQLNNDSSVAGQTIFIAPTLVLSKEVAKMANAYIIKSIEDLESIRDRSDAYFITMDAIFRKKQLPVELKYLAVVESELKSKALSRVGAGGIWQLMPATARVLGLKVNANVDERKLTSKSTSAAASYLKDLYASYGDWLLVIAAYNTGPGNVDKAIRRAGTRDYWKLQHLLPAETRGHVRHYIAVHYFFEGRAGETTVGKKELAAHKKATEEFFTQKAKADSSSLATQDIAKEKTEARSEQPEKPVSKNSGNVEMVLTRDSNVNPQVAVEKE